MDNVVNSERLSDSNIKAYEKLRTSIYLKKGTYLKIDSLINLSGATQSRNDIIEKAIDFFFAYTTTQMSQDYLCGVFGSKIEGIVGNLATRISRGNFRTAVELDLLTRELATAVQVNRANYEKLRVRSIHDVKTLNGSIDIFSASNDEVESDDPPEQY